MSTQIQITPKAGITIGSTEITSGTDNRILFQNGGKVSQSSMLTFTEDALAYNTYGNFANTFKRIGNNFGIYAGNGVYESILGGTSGLYLKSGYDMAYTSGNNHNFMIGTGSPVSAMYINSSLNVGIGTTSPQARLDIRSQGALSTDVAFRVRNSADTYNVLACYGSELTIIGRNESTEPRLLINRAGSTRMLLGGTTDLNITFPSTGKGEINSGAQGIDIISSSGEIKTRNSSTYTTLNGNFFGIGRTPSARLDVQAQGALSTDLALRVRNSADTQNSFQIDGLGQGKIKSTSYTPKFSVSYDWAGSEKNAFVFTQNIQNFRGQEWTFDAGYNGNAEGLVISNDLTGNDKGYFSIRQNNFNFGGVYHPAEFSSERKVLRVYNGVPPSARAVSETDFFKMYSADIVAGNAAPHFQTENGDVIKLYKQSSAGISTVADIVTVLTNLGLLG